MTQLKTKKNYILFDKAPQMLEEIPPQIKNLNPWRDYQPTGNLTTTALVILAIITSIHILGWLYIFLGKEPE